MTYKRWLTALFLSTTCAWSHAQEVDSLFLTDELTSEDSLSIFMLIDSLMTIESEQSQFVARINYNSNVLSAGRTLGIEQFGLSPGISYYHKSGVFADVTSYWSNDFDPRLYLTTASLGYMHIFSRRLSAITSFDHYFYHQGDGDTFLPYTNAISVSPSLDFKLLSLRLDYSFYFGDAYANRIMPGLSFKLKKNNILGFDRISIYPSCYVLFGDETITQLELVPPQTLREARENKEKYGIIFTPVTTEKNVFGVMNYSFSLPVNMTLKNWLFNVSYTYSIPVALEDEPLTLEESGFVSAGISYFISLKPVK